MNIIGNPKASWSDIDCPFLGDDKKCEVATRMVGEDIIIDHPYHCSACTASKNARSEACHSLNMYIDLKVGKEKLEKAQQKFKVRERQLGEGVGTEVHRMIPAWLEKPGCKCKDMARKMNVWGTSGCEVNRVQITNHLLRKANEVGFFSWVPEAATKMVINRMLTSAINKVKAKEQNNPNKWYCAVTTAPRKIPTLDTCLESLQIAGWEPFIFAEPDSERPKSDFDEFYLPHAERKGVWHNWLHSLRYGIENTDANIFLTVQDDSLFHPDSKAFAEKILWPSQDVGFISLYTPKHYSIKPKFKTKTRPKGVNRIHTKSLWGACGLVWPRSVVEAMLEHPFIAHNQWYGAKLKTASAWEKMIEKRKKEPWRIQNSDTAIGKLMGRMKRTMWFCDPSPVQHISLTSATGHGGNKGRRNCGRCASWDESLFDQIPISDQGREFDKFFNHDDIIIDIPE
tara:strand:+ start:6806 stop:8170 length:1365 start_codon:yes stop_codon:yes gene_type:complete